MILFALADRFCGGGLGWRSTFPGRPLYYALVVLPAALWFVSPALSLASALALVVWRSGSWRWFGASLAPSTTSEVFGTWVRHLLIIPAFLAVLPWPDALIRANAFAVVATGAGCLLRLESDRGRDVNAWVEAIRGATLGLLLVAP